MLSHSTYASIIQVAIGVIINSKDQILISKRSSKQHQGNKWEFPGGKVEDGETAKQALSRELKEELGIVINDSQFLLEVMHNYSDGVTVMLNVFEVRSWSGQATSREGQPLLWVDKRDIHNYKFPVANEPILQIYE